MEIMMEALDNAHRHGSKEGKTFSYGLLIARRGVCQAFKDEGGFFKREDIKRIFETKEKLRERDPETTRGGYGVNFITGRSDMIEVNTSQGVLYCANLLENVLKDLRIPD